MESSIENCTKDSSALYSPYIRYEEFVCQALSIPFKSRIRFLQPNSTQFPSLNWLLRILKADLSLEDVFLWPAIYLWDLQEDL